MDNKDKLAQIFATGDGNPTLGQYFIGESFVNTLAANDDIDINVGNVTFEPGCRNNWHVHNGYQVLLVTAGKGWYQEDGKEAQSLSKGDVVVIKDGIKHWHGAKKDSWFEHIAITNGTYDWLEEVNDEHYNNL